MKTWFIYILANKRNGTLYVGVTGDLAQRLSHHRHAPLNSFTKKYGLNLLVYLEERDNPSLAIAREKQLKKWNRKWKVELIEDQNPEWDDLSRYIPGSPLSRG